MPKARSGFAKRFPARDSVAARNLAENVRKLRKERGFSQADLARAVGIDQAEVSKIENCRANPTLLVLEHIAGALGCELGELFDAPPRSKRRKES